MYISPKKKKAVRKGKSTTIQLMPWKSGEAHIAHYTNLHTDTRAPRGPATQAEASEADLSGNQPIATHEGSLKFAANAKPKQPRQSVV